MNNIFPMRSKPKTMAEKLRHWLDEKNKPAPKKPMATRTGPRPDPEPPRAA
jgi:hypothetical protein